ncbi:type I-E CRISPR-associated protein Cas6/Cse3/CasE [Amycolatopsis lurida]
MTATLERPTTNTTHTATLTLISLNHPKLRHIHSWTNQHTLHRAVMSFFPESLPGTATQRRATNNILHRYDTPTNRPARLLVQHSTPMLPKHTTDPHLQHASLEPLLTTLHTGQEVRFRIVLNAVRSQNHSNTRIPITDPGELATWGTTRLAKHGLRDVHLTDSPHTTLARAKTPLWTAQYDGIARIRDTQAIHDALLHGIGRSKAYGCGLLSLAPQT